MKTIAAALLAVFLLAGCGSDDTGPSQDEIRAVLQEPGVTDLAYTVCAAFEHPDITADEVRNAILNAGIGQSKAGLVMRAAISEFCPEHGRRLRA